MFVGSMGLPCASKDGPGIRTIPYSGRQPNRCGRTQPPDGVVHRWQWGLVAPSRSRNADPVAIHRLLQALLVGIVIASVGASSATASPALPAGPAAVSERRLDSADPVPSAPPRRDAVVSAYVLPVTGTPEILRPFEQPPTPYAAGHRGVDLATSPGEIVRAAAGGTVVFAGEVAGRGIVVIAHPDGVSTEYEPIAASVRLGQAVGPGDPIGQVSGQHADWPTGEALHWGARRGGVYFDPMTLLAGLGPVHLIGWS
jgi:murein DD-endopeptidase MepM/ murein hydrolase activator NlpD